MDFTGKFEKALDPVKGKSAKGEWQKQDFVFKTQDQYPKNICVTNWNNKVDMNGYRAGDVVKVYFDIESREYNGKWFTNVTMWKAENIASEQSQQSADSAPFPDEEPDIDYSSGDDLPF